MADFCYDYDPGGLGGHHYLGDFKWCIEALKNGDLPKIDPGYFVVLGICEGHGCSVSLCREEDGSYMFVHDVIEGESAPEPVKVRMDDPNWFREYQQVPSPRFVCSYCSFSADDIEDIIKNNNPEEPPFCPQCKRMVK